MKNKTKNSTKKINTDKTAKKNKAVSKKKSQKNDLKNKNSSDSIKINGISYKVSVKPVVIGGKIYIPIITSPT